MAKAPQPGDIDFLTADRFSALGDTPVIIADLPGWNLPEPAVQAVCIGVDAEGRLPPVDPGQFDILVTTAKQAPAPWVSIEHARLESHLRDLAQAAHHWPAAATILCRVLRISETIPFSHALDVESLAYSTLLGGAEFQRWRIARGPLPLPGSDDSEVLVERDEDLVTVTLNNPGSQNAMTAGMRDALHGALANILDDPTGPELRLRANGRCFSTGGALGEFGSATDLSQAHIVRTLRSCARLLHSLGGRGQVYLQGACVGSGIEIPAAAGRRIAGPDAWFQLPELRMGLIPGAGGTASIARAIGRHRTAWMVLSGRRIRAKQALAWGLVHEIAR
ncbi:MAG: enoyl-CoA hydratase/isomerase family protein [Blastomonas fulva]|uniref:enoyl-CoA hydratase/isomerase family protein n=1 Tax=Blastomonas fulva TaxID=1550728 RepID=UPI004034F24C